jgi:hypothetical protein
MTQEELLFTFCPPAPPERTKDSSMSDALTSSAAMRCSSWASLSGDGSNELIGPEFELVPAERQIRPQLLETKGLPLM